MRKQMVKGLVATVALTAVVPTAGLAQAEEQEALVWVRDVSEAAAAKLSWEAATETATLVIGGKTIKLPIGARTVEVGERTVELSVPVQLLEGRTMVPKSLVTEVLGVKFADVENVATAKKFFEHLQRGMIVEAHGMFADTLRNLLAVNLLGMTWEGVVNMLGQPVTQAQAGPVLVNAVHRNVELMYQTELGAVVKLTVRLNEAGQVDDFMFEPFQPMAPAYKKPEYDDASQYIEREVVVGSGTPYALPGTLTMPVGKGPFPAVVLVHGSGAQTRDEDFMGKKVFRDLAVGLAAKGVAVLRYDKRTLVHTGKAQSNMQMTVKEETIEDALAAVDLLARTEGIDAQHVYLLGHSLGGMLSPRIVAADRDKKIAGVVVMAGNSRPLEDVIVDQFEYFAKLNPVESVKQQLAMWKEQAAILKEKDFSAETAVQKGFKLGAPAYWADLRDFHAAEASKEQDLPRLVLQGEADYQVTVEDFEGWKKALAGKTNTEFKLYPKLNHFFVEEEGKLATPQSQMQPGNVPAYVIEDIAAWILKQAK
jgi:dienelactone hydrolase